MTPREAAGEPPDDERLDEMVARLRKVRLQELTKAALSGDEIADAITRLRAANRGLAKLASAHAKEIQQLSAPPAGEVAALIERALAYFTAKDEYDEATRDKADGRRLRAYSEMRDAESVVRQLLARLSK